MRFYLPKRKQNNLIEQKNSSSIIPQVSSDSEMLWSILTCGLAAFCLALIFLSDLQPVKKLISPILAPLNSLQRLSKDNTKVGHEVFGFAPWWNLNKLDNVDFDVLTTLAYFGVPVMEDGNFDTEDLGYAKFQSRKATELFAKAHQHNTRVVLTVTQMDNDIIETIMQSETAKERAIENIVTVVKERGIDGVNVDFEYAGTPPAGIADSYSDFIARLSTKMHQELPGSKVTISVYAMSAKDTKLYDIASLGKSVDGVFMMAYDFAVRGSEKAMPTAPLYGHKTGKYYYDIATAVDDFLAKMPAEKLILGVPYYGYDYLVYTPGVKAETRPNSWRGRSTTQTYENATTSITAEKSGWDDQGKVGWKAYYVAETDTWRMFFLDDERSLAIKYDFAKEKHLAGVGMWALGFDEGKTELWTVLREKFGTKLADNRLVRAYTGGVQ